MTLASSLARGSIGRDVAGPRDWLSGTLRTEIAVDGMPFQRFLRDLMAMGNHPLALPGGMGANQARDGVFHEQ